MLPGCGAVGGDSSWDWAEGDAIAPGRTILKGLGGGSRYEVALVFHAITGNTKDYWWES